MSRIGFVACSKTKLPFAAPAAALYSSALFRKSLLAALDANDRTYVLSALHGVLPLSQIVEPYDITLKNMASSEKRSWAISVKKQLKPLLGQGDVATFYTGEEYVRPLRTVIQELGCRIHEPLARLSMGARLSRLQTINKEEALNAEWKELQPFIQRLLRAQQGGRTFAECTGRLPWPQQGLYIILEIPEGLNKPRIVRVGTHAVSGGSKTSLWNRLSTHRGTTDGRGSHRSSIFRSHVGKALNAITGAHSETWGIGQSAPAVVRGAEEGLEREVSDYISRLRVLWVNVPDAAGPQSDRAYLERNLIGILSRRGLLTPSAHQSWLGLHSPEWRIAATGLWNLNHILVQPDRPFPMVFNSYIDSTVKGDLPPPGPLAPPGWHKRSIGGSRAKQHELLLSEVYP